MLTNILIATGILWVLTALFVKPLTSFLVLRKLEQPAYAHLQGDKLDDGQQQELSKLVTRYYILADVLVLGTAGLIGGLLGYWFLGFSLEAKGWPGMLAFIGASLIGLLL